MVSDLAISVSNENSKRERWAVRLNQSHFYLVAAYITGQFENALRKHNHLGLVHGLVLALAKAGKLGPAK